MKELKIYEFQVKHLLDVLRLTLNYEGREGDTCYKRDLLEAELILQKVLNQEEPTGRERSEALKNTI